MSTLFPCFHHLLTLPVNASSNEERHPERLDLLRRVIAHRALLRDRPRWCGSARRAMVSLSFDKAIGDGMHYSSASMIAALQESAVVSPELGIDDDMLTPCHYPRASEVIE